MTSVRIVVPIRQPSLVGLARRTTMETSSVDYLIRRAGMKDM